MRLGSKVLLSILASTYLEYLEFELRTKTVIPTALLLCYLGRRIVPFPSATFNKTVNFC